MKRLPNWHASLAAHFAGAHTRKFQWGAWDCGMAICEGIKAVVGVDPGTPWRGTYSTEAQANALIGSDLGGFAAGIAHQHGFPEWLLKDAASPKFGRRGDVALVLARDPAHALGTIDHSGRFAWCASDRGFIRVPMRYWVRAWRIG